MCNRKLRSPVQSSSKRETSVGSVTHTIQVIMDTWVDSLRVIPSVWLFVPETVLDGGGLWDNLKSHGLGNQPNVLQGS